MSVNQLAISQWRHPNKYTFNSTNETIGAVGD